MSLLLFGATEITLVSVFGAILLGIIIYYCFVPMKSFFVALFAGCYIPSFRLISIKNRKLNVKEVVASYILAKKSKIAKYRKQKGLSQEELANEVGISYSYIIQIEAPNVVKKMSLEVLFDIAYCLEIDVKELL